MIIGFTVGVWDLLHEGHINFLKKAREQCDFLHVGIMNDYWVRVQKDHTRPIESLPLRINKLRQTGLADNIVILDTLDMTPYLQMSHVWFKGEDQKNMRPEQWPGTIYIERTPNISTTKLIEDSKVEKE